MGPPLRGTLSILLGTDDRARIETALGHYRARYDTVGLFENRVYDEVPAMLKAVARRGHAMVVATAKTRHVATRIVEHFGLARHFAGVYGAEPGGRFDAKVDLLAHLVDSGVVDPERAVMVGDRASDIVAAKMNGIRSIGALWGYAGPGELTGAGADVLCESPRALPGCLPD